MGGEDNGASVLFGAGAKGSVANGSNGPPASKVASLTASLYGPLFFLLKCI